MLDTRRLFLSAALLTILVLILTGRGAAQELGSSSAQQPGSSSVQEPVSHARIVRISYVQGTVEFNGQAAIMNSPVTQEGRLVTGTDGLVEIEFEDASKIRLASETEITFAQLARLSTGEPLTRVDLQQGEAEFLIPASSAGGFAVNVKGKNILFKQPGRFRILSTNSTPMEIAVWKGEAEVHDLESGQQVSVKDRETFALNPANLGEYDLERSVLADDLDRWSEQRDDQLKTNYVASAPTYNVYNQSYQSGGGYSGGYVPPYVYDFYGFGAGCPYYAWGFGSPFGFGSPCWSSGFGFSPFFNPFFFSAPVVIVGNPPIVPRRRPSPIRPPVVPTVAKGGTADPAVTPRFRSFREQGQVQRVFSDETFQRSVQQQRTDATHTPVIAPGQRTVGIDFVPPANLAPQPTRVVPQPPAQAPRSSPPAPKPVTHSSVGGGSRGSSGGSVSHSSGMGMSSHSAGGHSGGGGHR
jgi:hypothetical protein